MKSAESELEEKLRLVRWERAAKEHFDLLTIHSLLLDNNPKFQQLKQLVANYNQEREPHRIKSKQPYVEKLFKMLSELTRIPNSANQLTYLESIYDWAATNNDLYRVHPDGTEEKVRPLTATTKARSHSAYSRSTARPPSGNFQKRAVRNEELPPMNKNDPRIDYARLKEGEKEFYCGVRSIHPEYEHPKKRLKDYQRKVFYEDEGDSEVEMLELEPKMELDEKKLLQEVEAQEEEVGEGEEGQVEGEGENEEIGDVNIDDIPIEGEEAGDAVPEEPAEVVDKLKPRVKVYNNPKGIDQYNQRNYNNGLNELKKERNYNERKVDEDVEFAQLGAMWAQSKGRAKSEVKRKAESARIINKQLGMPYQKDKAELANKNKIFLEKEELNFVNFENIEPTKVGSKSIRPQTAFIPTNAKNRQELIKNAFITGKLTGHIRKYEPGATNAQLILTGTAQSIPAGTVQSIPAGTAQSIPSEFNIVGASLVTHGGPPKKKTFEQILRQAEQRVVKEANEEVLGVKEAFAKNKISIGANRIAKSITYYDKQLSEEDRFGGLITGMTMLKNPFIKVTKKKKKKKKK